MRIGRSDASRTFSRDSLQQLFPQEAHQPELPAVLSMMDHRKTVSSPGFGSGVLATFDTWAAISEKGSPKLRVVSREGRPRAVVTKSLGLAKRVRVRELRGPQTQSVSLAPDVPGSPRAQYPKLVATGTG